MREKDEILHTYRKTTHPKGENPKPEKFFLLVYEIGDEKCNVLQYSGTHWQDKKHSLKEALQL
jgi:hypothetical protein